MPDWPKLLEIFRQIRLDCDAAAKELGFNGEGLPALKFVTDAILNSAIAVPVPKRAPRRKSGPHERTKQFKAEWDATYKRELDYHRAPPARLEKWIAELDENVRSRKTKTGKILSTLEVEQVRKYRARLEQRLAALKAGKIAKPKIGEVKDKLAEQFIAMGSYGRPKGQQDATTFIEEKRKRAGRSIRERRRGDTKK